MSNKLACGLVIISAFLAACSQLLLKKSADKDHTNIWREYLNWRVVTSYSLLFFSSFINMYALRFVPYKLVPVLGTASYLFVLVLSIFMLKEQMNMRKIGGAMFILAGIIIFNLGGK